MIARQGRSPSTLRTLFFVVTGLAIVAAVLLAISLRRSDISNPDQLAKMSLTDLRDSEMETLIRAAFRSAGRVEIHWEGRDAKGKRICPSMSIADRAALDEFADNFKAGWDKRPTYYRPYPGIDYLKVEFVGPFNPASTYTGTDRVYVYGGRQIEVATPFTRKLADIVGIAYSDDPLVRQP